jgi:hypothetical protein
VSPSTYDCSLCDVTFGVISEDALWKAYREQTKHELLFFHRDEFEKDFRSKWLPKYSYPIVLVAIENNLEVFISSEILNTFTKSEELIEEIRKREMHYLGLI